MNESKNLFFLGLMAVFLITAFSFFDFKFQKNDQLALVTPVAGGETVAVVRPDCAGYQADTCFTSLSSWESNFGGINFGACAQGDLVCANTSAVAKIEGTWNSPDTEVVTIDGWTTSSNNYIRIYTDSSARHSGVWDSSKYILKNTIRLRDDNVYIDGLQIDSPTPTGSQYLIYCIALSTNAEVNISNNIFRGHNDSVYSQNAILFANSSGGVVNAWNNLFYNFNLSNSGTKIVYINQAGGTANIYNNTVIGGYQGITRNNGDVVLKNNIIQSSAGGYQGSFNTESTNNISDLVSDAPGSNPKNSIVLVFENKGTNNYHLSSLDLSAVDSGQNLSNDGRLHFATDIDGVTRNGTWDIGVDEYSGGGTLPATYQCNDGSDNDSDGLIDYPNDTGCSSATDNDEYNTPIQTDTTAPTKPTNLTAIAVSSSQINLTWTASIDAVGVVGYKIYRNGTQITTITSTSYSNTELTANTSYSYTVSAYDAAGNNSSQSTSTSATTQSVQTGGNIINATSCSQSAVQTAINNASDGDVVSIPAGNCIWTNRLDINKNNITISGTNQQTVISGYGFHIPNGSTGIVLEDMKFIGTGQYSVSNPFILVGNISYSTCSITQGPSDWIVSGNIFEMGQGAIETCGNSLGVIADNDFYITSNGSSDTTIYMFGTDDVAWSSASIVGTQKNTFIEDNLFYCRDGNSFCNHVTLGGWGASYVFRYNTVTDEGGSYGHWYDTIDTHGFGHGSNKRGTRSIEAYENTFIHKGLNRGASFQLRGGTGVIFNNEWILNGYPCGRNDSCIYLTEYRTTYTGNVGSAQMFYPDNSNSCSVSNYGCGDNQDTCCSSNEGYPCCDQIGRGINQTSEPVYIWNNKYSTGGNASVKTNSGATEEIQEGRDYFVNIERPNYTPYPYPHPLRGEAAGSPPSSDTTAPTKPTNLTAIAVSSSQINLTWTASIDAVGVVGYKIYRNGTQITTITSTSYSNTELTANTSYSYTVSAYDAAGNNSSQSTSTSATTQSVQTGGNIINATSCSQSAVQTAINNASDGDVVSIPAGNCIWTSDVTLTGKGITLSGLGKSTTIITNDGGRLNITPDVTHNITIKNIGWLAGASAKNRTLNIVGNITDKPVIITSCNFDGAWSGGVWRLGTAIYINGNYGLIYKNTFGEGGKETIHVGGNNAIAWTTDTLSGKVSATYIEDNIFANNEPSSVSAHHVVMGIGAGARYVVRHNEIHNANIDAHGYCGNPNPYSGTRWVEIYDNDIRIDQGFSNTNAMNIRGGSGAIFNNTITNNGKLNRGIQLSEYRVDENYCQNIEENPPCCCSTGGNGGEGWPCLYQVGRGKNNASEPLYIWNNIFSGNPVDVSKIGPKELSGSCDVVCGKTQLMTDYIQNQDNYVAGHGVAPDYYDDGTSLPGYVPYTYPHPLREEPSTIYQCSDNLDNDNDGLTDYPNDPGCISTTDNDEYNAPIVTDNQAPANPTISINNNTSLTNSTSVTLALGATDNIAVTQMQLSNDGASYSAWENYVTTKAWTLSSTNGEKTVYVKYRDSAGNVSVVASDKISLDNIAPIISNISDTTLSSTTAVIRWNTSELTTSQLEYGFTTNYGSLTAENTILKTSYETSLSGLSPDKTIYHYRVKSKDNAGNQSISIDKTFVTPGLTDFISPDPIIDFRASDVTQTSATLNWTATGDDGNFGTAASYDIRYSENEMTSSMWPDVHQIVGEPIPSIAGSTENIYIAVGLAPDTNYYFAIKALDDTGNSSSISNIISFKTLPADSSPGNSGGGNGGGSGGGGGGSGGIFTDNVPPAQPLNFRAVPANKQVALFWQNPTDADFVRVIVLRSTSIINTLNKTIDDLRSTYDVVYEGKKQEYIDTKLDNSRTYYYAISAYDKKPNFSPFSILSVQPNSSVESMAVSETEKVTSTFVSESMTPLLDQNLWFGLKNDRVRKLQEIFAKDKTIYPEGVVSGYFGELTVKAVKRFQEKYGIISSGSAETTGYGVFGPKTRIKFNEVYGNSFSGSVTEKISETISSGADFVKLTLAQINAIVGLLVSFSVDNTIVNTVRDILEGR